MVGDVPFAFQVGNKTLPTGKYRIERAPTGEGCLQLIRQQDGHPLMFVPTVPIDPKGRKSEPVLIFNHYGNNYFLSRSGRAPATGGTVQVRTGEELVLNEVKTETVIAWLGYSSSVKR